MTALPLLKRAAEDGVTFVLAPKGRVRPVPPGGFVETLPGARMPGRAPGPGEQYRFHFDMAKCIGCKCCVVACNEQNGNPAAINWRRVGEIEGGWYPHTRRSYLSMGCNHCVEPTCLSGCPVDAYTKDADTGIVRHSADTCIGCQYCTWNCSYGVPQYNPERGVVGKCDMCHGRLALDQTPACVSACPEGAIAIEIVNVAAWRAACSDEGRLPAYASPQSVDATAWPRQSAPVAGDGEKPDTTYASIAAQAGVPSADGSVSTTRITLPESLPRNARPVDLTHVAPAEPHWPLVVMTVLTQLSVGAFATIWLLQLFGTSTRLDVAALTSLIVAGLALTASTLHLGRPIYAYRALKMWRRSWLSREVLLFSAFSLVAALYAGMLWLGGPAGSPAEAGRYVLGGVPRGAVAVLGGITVLLGLAGVTASACIYRVPSRPAWNTRFTLLQFNLTAGVLGPLFAAALGAGSQGWLAAAAAAMAGAQMLLLAVRFFRLTASDSIELKGTAQLLSTTLSSRLVARGMLLAVGGVVVPLLWGGWGESDAWAWWGAASLALLLAFGGELLGRYLFFVSVVPRHMAAPYLARESEAA